MEGGFRKDGTGLGESGTALCGREPERFLVARIRSSPFVSRVGNAPGRGGASTPAVKRSSARAATALAREAAGRVERRRDWKRGGLGGKGTPTLSVIHPPYSQPKHVVPIEGEQGAEALFGSIPRHTAKRALPLAMIDINDMCKGARRRMPAH
ncbi:hypothetical protein GCM10010994_13090 [Chelatococcus reniformis]|uniref:Uncharacterized protein n=1 Tax=Chelatococcus reniformis TaxID=1494448 RepID=A0A916U139_9HYPH|nr:hypothetical protein GCM10010994_13090 [Chelatococcus reniformis]